MSTKDRISALGQLDDKGLYSQLITTPNNLELWLNVLSTDRRVNLETNESVIGSWSCNTLKNRLLEKHSRAAFPTAECRTTSEGKEQFWFKELLYCERPDIERFIKLVSQRHIVFEFTMRQKRPDTTPRNHGYPWRLTKAQYLQDLFAFQNQLRVSPLDETPP